MVKRPSFYADTPAPVPPAARSITELQPVILAPYNAVRARSFITLPAHPGLVDRLIDHAERLELTGWSAVNWAIVADWLTTNDGLHLPATAYAAVGDWPLPGFKRKQVREAAIRRTANNEAADEES